MHVWIYLRDKNAGGYSEYAITLLPAHAVTFCHFNFLHDFKSSLHFLLSISEKLLFSEYSRLRCDVILHNYF